ncbi:helix-turn-helix transcriptional regulator [Kitasatospora sp. RB6PN24]|uniref:helix-turn-helix domain-containing protein n=1 Tax=Kitasatospora humi TaxID=2893891 RepID=UPI001E38A289|nr:helix-turn-helix transcriptional regulator [Kitasatospora humi]MCC9306793.1 helix-turn-helix transcriptional regulator [Kitasatospora humi]
MSEQELDVVSSPVLRFGTELRRLRRQRGWSQNELAKRMGYSNTLISYLERGQRSPTKHFAVKADETFGTGQAFYDMWRRIDRASLLEGVEEYMDAEGRCRQLRTYQTSLIPGLFQTPEYAGALARAAVRRGSKTEAQAEEYVVFLAARQKRVLDRANPPRVHAVVDEGCINRLIGGPKVMARQLDHVIDLADRPNITLQVAPLSLGELNPFTFPIVLLTLPDRSVVGYGETHARGYLERGRLTCAAWERDYDQLVVESLATVASLDRIRAVRKGLE